MQLLGQLTVAGAVSEEQFGGERPLYSLESGHHLCLSTLPWISQFEYCSNFCCEKLPNARVLSNA